MASNRNFSGFKKPTNKASMTLLLYNVPPNPHILADATAWVMTLQRYIFYLEVTRKRMKKQIKGKKNIVWGI
jgi:hypothetical protein